MTINSIMSGRLVCEFKMQPEATVKAVKARISELKGIPVARQDLFAKDSDQALPIASTVPQQELSLVVLPPEYGVAEALGSSSRHDGLWPAKNIATVANGMAPSIILKGTGGKCRCKIMGIYYPEMRWFKRVDRKDGQKMQQYRCYVPPGTVLDLVGDFYDACGPELMKFGGAETIWVRVRWPQLTAATAHDQNYIGYMSLSSLDPDDEALGA